MGTRTDELLTDVQRAKPEPVVQNDLNEADLMRYESHRLATFSNWPLNAKVSASKIAKAGFYYTGRYLEARCTWCSTILSTWEYGDQVMARHRRAKPDCPFVKGLSNNVPLSTSPQPPSLNVTPQTSQIDQLLPSPDVVDTGPNHFNSEENQRPEAPIHPEHQTEIEQQHESDLDRSDPNSILGLESGLDPGERTQSQLLSAYFCEERRLRSFRGWPLEFLHPVDLAKSGFIYSGINDCVRCVFCLGYVGSWERTDQPEAVHLELFPQCQFVQGIDCGNKPMTHERRSEVFNEISSRMDDENPTRSSPNFGDAVAYPMDLGPSTSGELFNESPFYFDAANFFIDNSGGSDETGIRPRGRDLNSGPEKGPNVLTLKDPNLIDNKADEMIGIIKHSGPAHQKYATLEARMRTFREWPPALRQQPKELADAGFYYIGLSDQVKCFYCDGGLRNWQPEDDPWVEHSRWFSKCGFIRLVKGDEFIGKCLVSKPPESLPEITVGSHDRSQISEEALQAMMISREVQEALNCGIDLSRIKMALRKKWEETGAGFSASHHLIEAAVRGQHDQEERVSIENNPSESPFSSVSPERLGTLGGSGASNSSLGKPSSPRLEVGCGASEDPRQKLPSPSIPDKSCKNEEVEMHQQEKDKSSNESMTSPQDLERENRRLKEERTCKICMDNEIGVVFLPCGHLICCYQCAPALTNCPLCRQPIHGTVKTYMS